MIQPVLLRLFFHGSPMAVIHKKELLEMFSVKVTAFMETPVEPRNSNKLDCHS
jgi:hypothetical protein